jgi:hypothetical protein
MQIVFSSDEYSTVNFFNCLFIVIEKEKSQSRDNVIIINYTNSLSDEQSLVSKIETKP